MEVGCADGTKAAPVGPVVACHPQGVSRTDGQPTLRDVQIRHWFRCLVACFDEGSSEAELSSGSLHSPILALGSG